MFDPQLAEIRFGYGLSPVLAPPSDASEMLMGLQTPDTIAARFPTEDFAVFRQRMVAVQEQRRIRRDNRGTEIGEAARKQRNLINKAAREAMHQWAIQTFLRRTWTETAFRERLVAFWADHFTAFGKGGVARRATSPYIDDAIRPHIAGSFADLLISAVMHPVMLDYLDQIRSMGPGSVRARKSGGKRGLNENLAREVLELHTLGVDGPYGQDDVRQLAELFTGMSFQAQEGFKFRKDFVEPGPETVLGKIYADDGSAEPIRAVLRDLAVHPATARHLAEKIATHFTSDTPEPDLIAALEVAYLETGGYLMAVYSALLSHPAAWDARLRNFKPGIDFLSSAMRALAVPAEAVQDLDERDIRRGFMSMLARMGQAWQRPNGPDGWPEQDSAWLTPQGLAARVRWAMHVPEAILPDLPDPRDFVETALGSRADDAVRFAAAAAESRPEGIGLVLMSPAFQRR